MREEVGIYRFGLSVNDGMKVFGYLKWWDAYDYMNFLQRNSKNTITAQKLADVYEQRMGLAFPGGRENAYVKRLYPGHWQRSDGAWSWSLESISNWWKQDTNHPQNFGSDYPAKECAKDPELFNF